MIAIILVDIITSMNVTCTLLFTNKARTNKASGVLSITAHITRHQTEALLI